LSDLRVHPLLATSLAFFFEPFLPRIPRCQEEDKCMNKRIARKLQLNRENLTKANCPTTFQNCPTFETCPTLAGCRIC
jgi:hypothetical protein